ncbi:MAG TPA: PP2C family protein-serine/threonine phosphatase [Frankiaceae bacterium]|jgi:serine phosphatase RsbU (regulator of sigma subunit)|nr:PP2C family protein-serine/threonine phosphatase [Frankiaceae bacterium]
MAVAARRAYPAVSRSLGRLSVATIAAVVITVGAAGFGAWATHSIVRDQERRLLTERASEVGLLFTSSIGGITSSLTSTRGVLQATDGSSTAFERAVKDQVDAGKASQTTLALLAPVAGGGYRVVAEAGPMLKVGQVITGERAAAFDATRGTPLLVSTPVVGSGVDRAIGFAINASAAVGGIDNDVLYRESSLGTLSAGRQAGSAPFHEVNVVLYASNTRAPEQLIISTTGGALPTGGAHYTPEKIGATTWLLGVSAKGSLVGGVATNAWWILLLVAIAAALLLAALIEFAVRRRDAALALYVAEHQQAETLQRSLLPSLPQLPDLELAARYLAGGAGQKVGGDWFDAFALTDGSVGFAIGDVIGHDLEAAAAMSQVRAALRAYAYEGGEPAEVLSQLDRLVLTFELTQLVSVVYGVLSPLGEDGSRTLRLANAGHLPPLLQDPVGQVTEITDGASVVIGVPYDEARAQTEQVLAPGSTLLLFTDGLLEGPDLSLTETIPQLVRVVAAHPLEAGCEALCDRVLESRPNLTQRDDIALLALRLQPVPAPAASAAPGRSRRPVELDETTGRFIGPLLRR